MNTLPKLILPDIDGLNQLEIYEKIKGFQSFKKAIMLTPDSVIDVVKKSGLRGRGGACFPTGLKWSFMPKESTKPKYLCVNGDESEPGSFKDRQIFEFNPYQLIEGIMISGYAMGIKAAYIYIRGEYHYWVTLLNKAIENAYEHGYLGNEMKTKFNTDYSIDIFIHEGAGAYICGEETSLMNSIEGKRAYPRIKPPFPAQNGLWGCPTTINNVETITAIPAIFEITPESYAKIGAERHPGTLLFGISGNVNSPGVYELPTGLTLKEIIYDICGGVPNNKKVKAVIPGGSSMPPLSGDELDAKMDEESLKQYGTHIGTGGIIVIDEDADIVDITLRIAHFYHHESCGQCTPCREGCGWMEKILKRIKNGDATENDINLILDIADNIEGNTVCALGDAAAWPVRGFILKFKDEFLAKVKDSRKYQAPNIAYGKKTSKDTLIFEN